MNQSITTLALNLLVSERLNHRIIFAGKIIEILNLNKADLQQDENSLDAFFAVISKCTQEPNCEEREVFFTLAKHFNTIITGRTDLSAVA